MTSKEKKFVIGICIISAIVWGIDHIAYGRSSTSKKALPIRVSVAKITSDYEANEVAADDKYKDKIVEITGFVKSIQEASLGEMDVLMGPLVGGKSEVEDVQAFFGTTFKSKLVRLKRGQKITIHCKVSGLMLDIVVANDCRIVKY